MLKDLFNLFRSLPAGVQFIAVWVLAALVGSYIWYRLCKAYPDLNDETD